jgi:hypothetical protein
MDLDLRQQIHRNATTLRAMHARIHQTFATRGASPAHRQAWQDACATFQLSYDALAFPGGYEGAFDRLIAGDPHTMEAAITFLELRPYFFRSGYMHQKILRYAKRAPLSKPQAQRFRHVLARLEEWREIRRKQRRRKSTVERDDGAP